MPRNVLAFARAARPGRLPAIGWSSARLRWSRSQIIGFCNIGLPTRGAQLSRLYLPPTYIGRGIGRRLLERGEAFMRTRRLPSYYCFVHKDNELGKRFYLRHGFRHHLESDQNDEWYMEKQLTEDQVMP